MSEVLQMDAHERGPTNVVFKILQNRQIDRQTNRQGRQQSRVPRIKILHFQTRIFFKFFQFLVPINWQSDSGPCFYSSRDWTIITLVMRRHTCADRFPPIGQDSMMGGPNIIVLYLNVISDNIVPYACKCLLKLFNSSLVSFNDASVLAFHHVCKLLLLQ